MEEPDVLNTPKTLFPLEPTADNNPRLSRRLFGDDSITGNVSKTSRLIGVRKEKKKIGEDEKS